MTDLNLIVSQIRQRLEILYQEIDKIEQGGGGGGDTGDYNDLTNKPQINSVTLSGNKSLASLGIAAAATTYTKDETDGLLSNKADKSTTYTKTETGTEITNAINALDVASVGGAGSYIQAISEADGKISATSQTMDTTPTSESTKAITSGAVYTVQDTLTTAVNGKAALTDVFGLGNVLQPTAQEPADMNDITNIGVYTCSATYIDNLSNRPENKTGVNFYFEVRRLTTTRWMQTAYYQSNDADCFYIRWKTVNSWTAWYKFTDVSASVFGTGTALTTGQNLNDITTLGVYNANTPTIANSLYYCPVATAFRMEVTTLNGSTRFIQKIYTVDTTTSRITIYTRGYTVSGWSNWAKFEGAEAPSLHIPTP